MLSTTDLSYEAAETTSFMDTIVNIFPSNFLSPLVEANMLQIIVMAILIGFAVILVGEKASSVYTAVDHLNAVFMKVMELILKLSPIGVFCLLCPVIAENGACHHRFAGHGLADGLHLLRDPRDPGVLPPRSELWAV